MDGKDKMKEQIKSAPHSSRRILLVYDIIGMGDTSFSNRYDTNDFLWYRYQISIPIPVSLSRIAHFYWTHYRFQNGFRQLWKILSGTQLMILPSSNFIKHTSRKKIRIFQLFLRLD